jgi:Uncharacterized conserved protein
MKIAVLGAGVSGLTVARQLKEKGNDVYIYEKEKEKGYSFYRIRKHMVVEYDDSNGHHMNERIEYA